MSLNRPTEKNDGDKQNRKKGRILLEGESRMENLRSYLTKIDEKTVYVNARRGSTLNGVLNRLKNNLSDGDKDSVIVIQGGVNDIYRGDSVRTVCDNIIKILGYLKGKVKGVIVTSIIPTENSGRNNDPEFPAKMRQLNYEILGTVKRNGGYYLDLIDTFQNRNGELNRIYYEQDLLHLNEQGNRLLSSILKEWVTSFLGDRLDEESHYKGSRIAYPSGGRK